VADFVDALDAALHAHYSVRGEFASPVESKRGFQARVRALEKAYGSQAGAARAAGIDPTTWSRWKKGKQTPGRSSLARIAGAHLALLRAAKVASKGYPGGFEIKAIVAGKPVGLGGRDRKKSTYYNGGSSTATAAERTFRAERLTATQVKDVVNAWAAGKSPDDVATLLMDEIQRAYPARFEFEGNNVTVTIV
jgi:transcriptional regulator with XRE-family HTH domain